MVFKNKEQYFIKCWKIEWSFFWTKKNVKVKPIESYKQRERYQAYIVILPNFYEKI